jgi:hypothetical protein
MTWFYRGEIYNPVDPIDPKKIYGFVYLIENLETGKKYIGKKFFWSSKTKIVNKKKKKLKVESNWKDYYGSSEILCEDVNTLGKDKFKRTILHLCKTKAECAYLEVYEQVIRNVLFDDGYYNRYIQCRINSSHVQSLKPLFVRDE